MKKCPYCGEEIQDKAIYCRFCHHDIAPEYNREGNSWRSAYNGGGYGPGQPYGYNQPYGHNGYNGYNSSYSNDAFACGPEGKSRGVAALLAIFLGGLGIHYFYLGKSLAGILSIVILIATCGMWSVVMLIQGILMFCMDNETFRQKYVLTDSQFPLF